MLSAITPIYAKQLPNIRIYTDSGSLYMEYYSGEAIRFFISSWYDTPFDYNFSYTEVKKTISKVSKYFNIAISENGTLTLDGIPMMGKKNEQWSLITTYDYTESFYISTWDMEKIQKLAPFTVEKTWIRPAFEGVYILSGKAVATDTYKLAEITLNGDIPDIALRNDTLEIIKKYNIKQEKFINLKNIKISKDSRWYLQIISGGMILYTSILKWPFPDYERFFPKQEEYIEINRKWLIEILKKNTHKNGHCIIYKDKIKMGNEVTFEIAIEAKATSNFSYIALNSDYMIDALNLYESDTVKIYSNNQVQPICIYSDDTRSIIMPLKI